MRAHGYDVESKVDTRWLGVTLQIEAGGPDESLYLPACDRFGARQMARIVPESHFDEHKRMVVDHDEVDFTHFTSEISLDEPEPPLFQPPEGGILGGTPSGCRRFSRHCPA